MPEFLRRALTEIQAQWGRLDVRHRIVTAVAAILTLGSIVGLVVLTSRPQWTTLGTFETAVAAQIRSALAEKGHREGTDFRLTGGGRTLEVDRSKRDQITLDLGEEGLTADAQIKGWSLFDEFDWTLTDREERIRILRANIGEMRKTIRTYAQVEDVRIDAHFVDEQPLFKEDEVERTASVMLVLKPGASLKAEQVKAIRSTVSNGLGIAAKNISITDQYANLLDGPEEGEGAVGVKQREVERETERALEKEIRGVLGRVLGADKVSASVNVEFDWDAVTQRIEEHTAPGFEQLKASEENDRETLRGTGIVPRGEPGVQSNVPTFDAREEVGPVEYERTRSTINYLWNKTATERIRSPYVKRVTAAVALDGIWKEEKDAETGESKWTYEERPPEEIRKYEGLVRGILGESPERQDVIVVEQVSYDRTREFERIVEEREERRLRRWSQFGFILGVVAIAGLILVFQAYRARLRLRAEEITRSREMERQRALAAAEAALAGEITLEEQERQEMIRRASDLARSKPQLVAALIRTWLAAET